MALHFDPPVAPVGRPTPGLRRQEVERAEAAERRARRRFLIAQTAAACPQKVSLREKRRLIGTVLASHGIGGPLPGLKTIGLAEHAWAQGRQSMADFQDPPGQKRGRKPKPMLPEVARAIREFAESGQAVTVPALKARLVERFGAALEAVGAMPTRYLLNKRLAEIGQMQLSAARQGSRAAELDAALHGMLVTTHTHDTWAIDECTLPIWIRRWEDRLQRWVSVLIDIILIVDVCSRVIVGYYIPDPSERVYNTPDALRCVCTGRDVLAALLSAGCKELATPATEQFAGYCPNEIRWDNASIHEGLREEIRTKVAGVRVPRLPVRRAKNNGAVERRVQHLKAMCAALPGHVDDALPEDRVTTDLAADPGLARSLFAGKTGDRLTRRSEILVDALMDIDELRAAFDKVVERYNYTHVNRIFGRTPAMRYKMRQGRRRRSGRDLVLLVDAVQCTAITNQGIAYREDNRQYYFAPGRDGWTFMPNTAIVYRRDPHHRGIFAFVQGQLAFLKPYGAWAAEREGQQIAALQRMQARGASDRAAQLRLLAAAEVLGADGLRETAAVHAVARARYFAAKRGDAVLPPFVRTLPGPPAPSAVHLLPAPTPTQSWDDSSEERLGVIWGAFERVLGGADVSQNHTTASGATVVAPEPEPTPTAAPDATGSVSAPAAPPAADAAPTPDDGAAGDHGAGSALPDVTAPESSSRQPTVSGDLPPKPLPPNASSGAERQSPMRATPTAVARPDSLRARAAGTLTSPTATRPLATGSIPGLPSRFPVPALTTVVDRRPARAVPQRVACHLPTVPAPARQPSASVDDPQAGPPDESNPHAAHSDAAHSDAGHSDVGTDPPADVDTDRADTRGDVVQPLAHSPPASSRSAMTPAGCPDDARVAEPGAAPRVDGADPRDASPTADDG